MPDIYDDLADLLYLKYNTTFPAAKRLAKRASSVAESRGYVKTLLGRRGRFNLWVPAGYRKQKETGLLLPEATAKWGKAITRTGTHKALNAILQGTAADIMKTAMVRMVQAGVTDVLGPPLMTVHDELVFSVPRTIEGQEAAAVAGNIMRHCMGNLLKVPLEIDDERGPNWGELK